MRILNVTAIEHLHHTMGHIISEFKFEFSNETKKDMFALGEVNFGYVDHEPFPVTDFPVYFIIDVLLCSDQSGHNEHI